MRVLLIEDNAKLASVVQIGLVKEGFAVDAFTTLGEGEAALSTVRYDAAILDLGLPDGDGISLLKRLRAQLDALPDPEAVRSLRGDVDGMSRLITQLLAATRLDFLAIGPDDRADISRVATNVATYLVPIAFGAGRSIEVIGADQSILVRGNSDALEQAVRNLVENAIKYSARRTTIIITVSDEPMIEVRDRGRGIAPELRKHVFERFQRADRRSSGAGLGLSIVQRAVEAHQGSVEVSDAPDGGAVLRIRLPPLALTVDHARSEC